LPALGLVACSGLFYQPSRVDYFDPGVLGFSYRDIDVPTPSGHRIRLRLVHHLGDTARGLVVHFHGNAQNLTAHFRSVAWMGLRGWDLLLVDYSGYGASEGEASQPQSIEDAATALDWAADSLIPTEPGRIVLYGQSLGGPILLKAFPGWKAKNRADLVVTEGAFDSYRGIAMDAMERHWITWLAVPLVPLLVSNEESPGSSIPDISPTPLLTLSCLDNQVVPARFQERVDDLARAPHFLWVQAGCKHIQFFRSTFWRGRFEAFVDSLPSPPPEKASP
jgi:fermentation-respiration switch protein FrsA (DUF1100 family)